MILEGATCEEITAQREAREEKRRRSAPEKAPPETDEGTATGGYPSPAGQPA